MSTQEYTPPCQGCLIFAVCQGKDILHLVRDCELVKNYLHINRRVIMKPKLEALCTLFGREVIESNSGCIIAWKF